MHTGWQAAAIGQFQRRDGEHMPIRQRERDERLGVAIGRGQLGDYTAIHLRAHRQLVRMSHLKPRAGRGQRAMHSAIALANHQNLGDVPRRAGGVLDRHEFISLRHQ